jgi:hypothetical protein
MVQTIIRVFSTVSRQLSPLQAVSPTGTMSPWAYLYVSLCWDWRVVNRAVQRVMKAFEHSPRELGCKYGYVTLVPPRESWLAGNAELYDSIHSPSPASPSHRSGPLQQAHSRPLARGRMSGAAFCQRSSRRTGQRRG